VVLGPFPIDLARGGVVLELVRECRAGAREDERSSPCHRVFRDARSLLDQTFSSPRLLNRTSPAAVGLKSFRTGTAIYSQDFDKCWIVHTVHTTVIVP
jgi:hypothetical protein